jgi:RNA polymerase sigma factor (sigma-70 family)
MAEPSTPTISLSIDADDDAPSARSGSARVAERDGHARFVAQLVERHRPALLRYVTGLLGRRAHDVEDVLQETYVRLLGARDLEPGAGRARAYVFKVATNLAYDRFRRCPETRLEDLPAHAELSSPDASPEHLVDFAQGLEILKKTVLGLKPRCRRVFLLRAAEELSYEAIAARLGVSKRTVEREMQHALEVCQRRLERAKR